MIRKPTAPQGAPRYLYSTRGLSLRILLLGVMLSSLSIALAGGQPVGASPDERDPGGDSARLASDTEPGEQGKGGQAAPPDAEQGGGTLSDQASDDSSGESVPAASPSANSPTGGSAGAPPDDWHIYNHWTDPSWPDPDEGWPGGRAPLPARSTGGFGWEPQTTPPVDPTPSTGWTQTPVDPADPAPGTPTDAPTATRPAPDPAEPDPPLPNQQTDDPTPPLNTDAPPEHQPGSRNDDEPRIGAQPQPATTDPLQREPVAAGPDDEDLGLGEIVDEPTPTPEPAAMSEQSIPLRAQPTNPAANEYHQTLVYSGLVGLALAAIGLTMVGLRRRRW